MPDLFKASPVIKKFYDALAKENPETLAEKIPDDYKDTRLKLQNLQTELISYKTALATAKFDPSNDRFTKLYNEIQEILSQIDDDSIKQFKFDKNAEKMYIKYLMEKGKDNTYYFSEWYRKAVAASFAEKEYELLAKMKAFESIIDSEYKKQIQLKNYQQKIIQYLSKWLNFMNVKINESTESMKQYKKLLSTSSRNTSFDYEETNNLKRRINTMEYYLTILFLLLLSLLIYVYHKEIIASISSFFDKLSKNVQN